MGTVMRERRAWACGHCDEREEGVGRGCGTLWPVGVLQSNITSISDVQNI